MSDGGKYDDARIEIRRRSGFQTRMHKVQEKEVSQVVRAEMGLEAVLSASFRTSHNTSVGDEDIELRATAGEVLGKSTDVRERVEVELQDMAIRLI